MITFILAFRLARVLKFSRQMRCLLRYHRYKGVMARTTEMVNRHVNSSNSRHELTHTRHYESIAVSTLSTSLCGYESEAGEELVWHTAFANFRETRVLTCIYLYPLEWLYLGNRVDRAYF